MAVLSLLCRYVFDGKPPDMKSGELVKRAEKRAEAEKELAQAQEQGELYIIKESYICVMPCVHVGDVEGMEKFQKRLVSHCGLIGSG